MQRKLKLATAVLVCLLMVSVAYAVLKYSTTVPNTATVTGYEVKLWNAQTSSFVTLIPWGSIETGTSNTTEQIFSITERMYIKNTGDYAAFVAWHLNGTTLPAGITVTMQYKTSTWLDLAQDDYGKLGSIASGGLSTAWVRWTLTIASTAPRGPINFDIILLGATTASG